MGTPDGTLLALVRQEGSHIDRKLQPLRTIKGDSRAKND